MNREQSKLAVRANKQIVFEFVETINRGDTEKLASMMADPFLFTDIAGEVSVARSLSERKGFWDGYINEFPGYRIEIEVMLSSGTDIALIGKTPNSHRPRYVEVGETLIWYARLEGGKISEWRIFATEGYAF